MVTYWANPKNKAGSSAASGSSSREEDDDLQECKKEANPRLFQAHTRLVDWIVKLLSDDIKKIVRTVFCTVHRLPLSFSYSHNFLFLT